MNYNLKHIFVVLFSVFLTEILLAQLNNRYLAEQFTIEQGLPTNVITGVLQDKEGYIWIGTQDGLCVFDGYVFKVFRHDPTDSLSIAGNYIYDLSESPNGEIWVATFSGLSTYSKRTKRFTNRFNNPTQINSLSTNNVYGVFAENDSIVWLKTEQAIERLSVKTNNFKLFKHKYNYFNFVLNTISYALTVGNNKIFAGSKDGLNIFDKNSERFEHFDFSESVAGNMVFSVLEEKDKIWVGTGNGLYLIVENKIVKSYLKADVPKEENKINTIYRSQNGMLWVGTAAGLYIFDEKKQEFTKSLVDKISLKHVNAEVTSIVEDASNILWIGTWEGLFKLDTKRKQFNIISKLYNQIETDNIRTVLKVDNELWFGTSSGGIFISSDHVSFRNISDKNSILRSNYVEILYKDSKNNIWIGTANGLYIADKKGNLKLPVLRNANLLRRFDNNRINSIIEDSEGAVWIGAHKGLFRLRNNEMEVFNAEPENKNALSSNVVYALETDKQDRIWIGTNDGLCYYSFKTKKFKTIKADKTYKGQGLCNNTILALRTDVDGNLWAGSEAGLNKIDLNTLEIKYYTTKNGFYNDNIYGILVDKNKNVWVTTNRGVTMLNPVSDLITNYDPADGLQGYEFNLGAVFKDEADVLYFGGIKGINYIHPDSVFDFSFAMPIKINSITKLDKTGKQIILNEYDPTIVLRHDDFMLSIDFTMLEFTRPMQNRYMYKMEGISDEWINLDTKHNTIFPSLVPGQYVFKVRGSISNSYWNLETTEINITVLPPFYKTPLAYALYWVLGILFAYAVYYYITRNLRRVSIALKERERIMSAIAEQKEELAFKNTEITDSMNYAQRIIQAMLPSDRKFKQILPQSFIIYKPKEIVSGDFFWITEKNDKVFIAAVDCTGHGVPGALMSIIGFDLLRDIVLNMGVESPAEVLNLLSVGVSSTFGSSEDMHVSDGMDMTFCVFDRKSYTLEYAGAMNPLYIIRNNNILEYKADRFSVGGSLGVAEKQFQNHEIELLPDDIFYLFSDGFADQFGGADGKKFKFRKFRHLLLSVHKLPLEEQKHAIENVFNNWRGDNEQVDDILIIGVKPIADN